MLCVALPALIHPVLAQAPTVPPGGAPPPKSGAIQVRGYIRVIDGDTVETYIKGNQVGVGLLGIDTPELNTPCGRIAADALQTLLGYSGALLDEDIDNAFDKRKRRLYKVVAQTRDLSLEMVRAGLARATGAGKNRVELQHAEAEARAARRGCLWGNPSVLRSATETQQTIAARNRARQVDSPQQIETHAVPTKDAGPTSAQIERAAITFASGFTYDVVTTGLILPTTFAVLPDGRILIAEQAGVVRMYKNGVLLANPFIDIRDHVNSYWDRGLIGLTVDPNFATNGYVYLFYTYENDATTYSGPKTVRLTRVTAAGDTASPTTEQVILGRQSPMSCNDLPIGTDCIASDGPSHSAGNIRFAPDGTMFITVGDGASFNIVDDDALRAQSLDSLNGKILHITKDGLGVPSNPYWNGDATANRSKVYARGVRNSFRMTVRPGTSTPVAGEVGWGGYDEINVVGSAANLGWPCYEGVAKQGGYESKPICQSLYANPSEVKPPLIEIPHVGLSAAVVGGEFYTGSLYPAEYRGSYFYGDYAANTMSRAAFDTSNNLVGTPVSFATEADGPVEIRNGPDGNLYYLSISTGELRRVRYRSSPDSLPPTIISLNPANGAKSVPPDAVVSANFSEEIDPARINDSTVTIVRMSTGAVVPSTVAYDANSRAAVVTPSSQFAAGESYQVRLLGGVGGVRDLAGNPLASNATWAFTVVALPPPGVTQLSDLQWTYMTNGWGPVEKDRSNGETGSGDGRQLTIGASSYAKGLGAHAASEIRYYVSGMCSVFQADVGVDEEVGSLGSVTFEVWGDGGKLYDSGIRRGADVPLAISLDVTGQKELRLVVTDTGDTASSDHADWANARITCSNTGDLTAPTVVSRTPASNATNVAVTSSIQATFSEALDPATVTPAAFHVLPDGDLRSIAGLLSYDNSTRAVILVPSPPLSSSTKYTVVLKAASGVTDLAGNQLAADVSWSFTTSASGPSYQYLSDMQWSSMTNGWGPAELDRSNGSNAAGDGVGLNIENVPYTKGIGVHAQSSIRYSLGGACTTFLADIGVDDEVGPNGSVTFQIWADGSQLFTSGVKTGTMPAQSITVDITGRQELTLIVDGGTDINSDHAVWGNAKVACTGANTKPSANMATPPPALQYKVGDVINFSGSASDEQDGNLPASALAWTVTIHHCPGGTCHTHPFLSYTGAASSFVVPDHGDDSHFEIQLTAKDSGGLTDIKTISLQPQTVQVTINTQPTGLQVGYGELTGTAPMVRNSIIGSKQSIYVTTPQGAYRFLSWSDNGAIQHTISIGSTAATYTATFTNDNTPPSITATSPVANSTGVAANTAVSVNFSEPIQASTVNATTFVLVRQGTTAPVTATIAYNATSRTATLQPTAALTGGAVYMATLKGGTAGVKDIAGNALSTDKTWSFTVATATGDTLPPTITSRVPAAGATSVSTASSVMATFSEPMNASTLNANTVTLARQGTTTSIAATVTYNTASRTVTLKPNAALAASTQYTATIVGGTAGAKDVAGNPLASNTSWNFTTAASTVTKYVSDLAWTSMTNGWGPVEKDRSNGEAPAGDGRVLTLNGATYAKGLGTHANSDVRFSLGGACSTFTANVGVDDEVGSFGSVVFEIWGDTTRLYASNTLTGTSATASVSVDVSGRSQLRLVVLAGADMNSDHADWADAKLVCNSSAPLASIDREWNMHLGEMIATTIVSVPEHALMHDHVAQHSTPDAAHSLLLVDTEAVAVAISKKRRIKDQT